MTTRQSTTGVDASVRAKIIEAALTAYGGPETSGRRFAEICEAAGVLSGSAYRVFPSGTKALLCAIHRETVDGIIAAIQSETEGLRMGEVSFEEALTAGLSGAIRGLRESPYCRRVLRNRGDLAVAYLLNRQPGGLYDILSIFTARCASSFGSTKGDLRIEASRFVWAVLTMLLRDPPEPGHDEPWPDLDEIAFGGLVRGPVADFVNELQLAGVARDGLFVPEVSASDISGTGYAREFDSLLR